MLLRFEKTELGACVCHLLVLHFFSEGFVVDVVQKMCFLLSLLLAVSTHVVCARPAQKKKKAAAATARLRGPAL